MMETMLDVIKSMDKATAREIAAHMKIDVRVALNLLREHEERNEIVQLNGMWQLPALASIEPEPPVPPAMPVPEDAPVTITEERLIKILTEKGPRTADELAIVTATTSRKIASTLALATNRGRVLRQNVNGRFCYCIPQSLPTPQTELSPPLHEIPIEAPRLIPPQQVDQPRNDVAVLSSPPAFTRSKQESTVVPTLNALARDIRRTKTRLSQLERCQGALRELNKCKKAYTERL